MRLDRLKTFALAQPLTTVVRQWGGLVFKVVGKVFVMLILDGEVLSSVIFKCTPDEFDELTQLDGVGQAPYCAKRMWVRVEDLAALPEKELQQRIHASYRLVVDKLPKKTRINLGL